MGYSNTTAHRKTPSLVRADLLAISKIVKNPFTENEIIELQNEFLTNGFHYFKVHDIQEGRRIINTFLHSLRTYYQELGCLTLSEIPLSDAVTNIYEILEWYGYLRKPYLEFFFLDQWYCDFLWIEATEELLLSSWFYSFLQLLENFTLNQEIPIFIVSYN